MPVPLIVPAVTVAPAPFATGIGSPVTIDSSSTPAAFDDAAVDGHALAGPDAQAVAGVDVGERDVALAAVGGEAARGRRRQVEQLAERVRGLAAGAELQHLADEHERRDDGRGLEVERYAVAALRVGIRPGTRVARTL